MLPASYIISCRVKFLKTIWKGMIHQINKYSTRTHPQPWVPPQMHSQSFKEGSRIHLGPLKRMKYPILIGKIELTVQDKMSHIPTLAMPFHPSLVLSKPTLSLLGRTSWAHMIRNPWKPEIRPLRGGFEIQSTKRRSRHFAQAVKMPLRMTEMRKSRGPQLMGWTRGLKMQPWHPTTLDRQPFRPSQYLLAFPFKLLF